MKRFNANTGEYVDLTTEEVAEHEVLIKEAAAHEKSVNDAKALKEIMLESFPETTKLWSEIYWEKK